MPTPSFVPVPRFHRELLPAWARDFAPCVPWTDSNALLTDLPLSRRETEAVLREWRDMAPGLLRQEAVRVAALAAADDGLLPGEASALETFQGRKKDEASLLRQRAQRLLLMAWVQEERVLEMRALNSRFAEQEQRLARLLADDEEESLRAPVRPRDDSAALLAPWGFVLESLFWFLPCDAALLVTDPLMTAELAFLGAMDAALAEDVSVVPAVPRLRGVRVAPDRLLKKKLPEGLGEQPRLFIIHE